MKIGIRIFAEFGKPQISDLVIEDLDIFDVLDLDDLAGDLELMQFEFIFA